MVVDYDSGLQSECCASVFGSGRQVGTQTDESDAVLSDQHPGQSHWTVAAVVLTAQCRRFYLRVVIVDTGKDRQSGAVFLRIEGLVNRSRFHQDYREVDFLKMKRLCRGGVS